MASGEETVWSKIDFIFGKSRNKNVIWTTEMLVRWLIKMIAPSATYNMMSKKQL